MKIPGTNLVLSRLNNDQTAEAAAEHAYSTGIFRRDIINSLLEHTERRRYLEIGVRDTTANFDHINAETKLSVDPGVEREHNPATYALTSDQFFSKVKSGELSLPVDAFDVVFVDGLHLAENVYRDISNALELLHPEGFIVLHDCCPPTIFHARENFADASPAKAYWNGTCWKAIQRFRTESEIKAIVIDVDWGVGVISARTRSPAFMLAPEINPFFEFNTLLKHKQQILNLVSIKKPDELQKMLRREFNLH